MQLTVHGKQMDVGDALRSHVSDKLEDINQKYFNRAIDATVTLAPEGHAFTRTHISIRVGKGIMVVSDAMEADPYVSFDMAADKVAKQLRRYKKKLRDHHERLEEDAFQGAKDYVLSAAADQDNTETEAEAGEDTSLKDDSEPLVIAEMATYIHTMSVAEAVMRMDLSGQPAILFRNAQHGGLNMIYRRSDGNVGWVDPDGNGKA